MAWLKHRVVALAIIPAVLLIAVLIISCLFRASPQKTGSGEALPVRIGSMNFPLPFFVADAKGFFVREGITVEMQDFASTDVLVEALVKGDVDTAVLPYTALFGIQNNTPNVFQIYFSAEETTTHPYSFLVVKPEIDSVQDLRGRKVVTRAGYPSRVQAESIFRNLGLDADNFELVQVAGPLIIPTFARSDVFACLELDPTITTILNQQQSRVLVVAPRPQYMVDPFPSVAGVLRTEFVKDSPDVAEKLKKAIDLAISFMCNNELETRAILQQRLQLDPRIAAEMYLPWFQTLDSTNRTAIEQLIEFSVENGVLDKRPDFHEAFYKH